MPRLPGRDEARLPPKQTARACPKIDCFPIASQTKIELPPVARAVATLASDYYEPEAPGLDYGQICFESNEPSLLIETQNIRRWATAFKKGKSGTPVGNARLLARMSRRAGRCS